MKKIQPFTLRQLEAFAILADCLSFKSAAEQLHLSASAVSQLVAELESVVGFRLFERSTRKVTLSSSGQTFLPVVQSMLWQRQQVSSAAQDVQNQAIGIVRIAAPQVIAAIVLPPIMAKYQLTQPRVTLRLADCSVENLVSKVAHAEVDIAIGPDRPIDIRVKSRMLFPSPWVVWCAPDHPIAIKKRIGWRDLSAHAIAVAGRDHETQVARMVANLPNDERIEPTQVLDNISTALGLAAAGLAINLSPAYVGGLAIPMGLVMRKIQNPTVMRQVCLYTPSQRELSPATQGFLDHLIGGFGKTASPACIT
ncbi:MAG: LysR family transcriptional regulator [Cytophagales bacterium]|nr:LysR family transcriptional regulator [Cytophagales bacterium]